MKSPLHAKALAYLSGHHVMTLACAGPWAAAVFYASEDFTLYFLSSPKSRHSQALKTDPRVAVTIQENYAGWMEIRGIQLEGTATALKGEERDHAIAVYAAKFPALAGPGAPGPIARALPRMEWFRITPQTLYLIDNSVAFGHRDRIDF